jgi:phosphatidylglycerophosphate synthase
VTRDRLGNWADAVTLSRVLLLPVLVWAAEATRAAVGTDGLGSGSRPLVLVVLLAIGASDVLDGRLARRSGAPPTRRGAILDAAADRLVQWTGVGYFTLRATPAFSPLPLWLAALLVVRDVLLLGVWLRQRRARIASFEHELHGKAATVTIFVALLASVSAAPRTLVMLAALTAAASISYSTARYAARLIRRSSSRTGSEAPRGGGRPGATRSAF